MVWWVSGFGGVFWGNKIWGKFFFLKFLNPKKYFVSKKSPSHQPHILKKPYNKAITTSAHITPLWNKRFWMTNKPAILSLCNNLTRFHCSVLFYKIMTPNRNKKLCRFLPWIKKSTISLTIKEPGGLSFIFFAFFALFFWKKNKKI